MGDAAAFLTPVDLALLEKVLQKIMPPSATDVEREACAMALVHAYQSGIHDEVELIGRMSANAGLHFLT